MTTDGGRAWQRQPGGALALETLNGNVVRVTAQGTGCPLWCHVQVETAGIGSSAWTVRQLPERVPNSVGNFGLSFARGGSDVYLLSLNHTAGGAQTAMSTLYRSTDNGQSWSSVGEPCPRQHGEVDSVRQSPRVVPIGWHSSAPTGRRRTARSSRHPPTRARPCRRNPAASRGRGRASSPVIRRPCSPLPGRAVLQSAGTAAGRGSAPPACRVASRSSDSRTRAWAGWSRRTAGPSGRPATPAVPGPRCASAERQPVTQYQPRADAALWRSDPHVEKLALPALECQFGGIVPRDGNHSGNIELANPRRGVQP